MADAGTAFRAFVVAQAGVSALIGDRMIPDELLQKTTMPAVTYHRISTLHHENINGSKAGMAEAIVEVRAYAASRTACTAICEAIRNCGVLDMLGVYSGVNFRCVMLASGRNDFTESPIDGTHELRYVSSQDYSLTYLEAV